MKYVDLNLVDDEFETRFEKLIEIGKVLGFEFSVNEDERFKEGCILLPNFRVYERRD